MAKTTFRDFPLDNASILFLSLIRPHHTNNFRISAKLRHPVCPHTLQLAVDRIHKRFPSVIAGFRQDFFHYRQVASLEPPIVQPDPGLLKPMTKEELRNCAFRVYHRDNTVSIEVFHALTDGFGAISTITALIKEYLHISGNQKIPLALPAPEEAQSHEVEDSYLEMAEAKPRHLPSRFSYLLPRPANADWKVRSSSLTLETKKLLDAAHSHGVTLNTLLTAMMASSVMELQVKEKGTKGLKPVRIMVPANLRKLVGSRTLRNCSLYSLPTLEGHQHSLSIPEICKVMEEQLKVQLSRENLTAMASYNVRTQNAWFFKMLPWKLKSAAMRLGYRFFGESNSSLTLTNLGLVKMPEELQPHVEDVQCYMTPRVSSPYGCTIISFGDKLTLNMSRFCPQDELGNLFFQKVRAIVEA